MALSKRIVELPLAGGLSQNEDKFKTRGLTTAQNMVMNKSGQMNKRHGYTELTDDTFNSEIDDETPTLISGSAIYSYNNRLVMAGADLLYDDDAGFIANSPWHDGTAGNGLSGDSIYSYSPVETKWINQPSGYKQVEYTTTSVTEANAYTKDPFIAVGSNYKVIVNTTSNVTSNVTVLDTTTDEVLNTFSITGIEAKVFYMKDAAGDYYFTFVSILPTSNDLRISYIKVDDILSSVSYTNTDTTVNGTDYPWDAICISRPSGTSDEILYVFKDTVNDLIYRRVGPTGTSISTWTDTATWHSVGLSSATDDNGVRQHYTMRQNTTYYYIRADIWDDTFSSSTTKDMVATESYKARVIKLIRDKKADNTAIGKGFAGTGTLRLFYDYKSVATTVQDHEWVTKTSLVDFDGTEITSTNSKFFNLSMASAPFVNNDVVFVILAGGQELQKTNYLVSMRKAESNAHAFTNARMLYSRSAGNCTGFALTNVLEISNNNYLTPMAYQSKLLSSGDTSMLIRMTEIDMKPIAMPSIDIGNSLLIGGGVPTSYTNNSIDYGFNWYPEKSGDYNTQYTTGGALEDGDYYYKTIYEITDTDGNLHRSYPSNSVIVTLSGGGSTQRAPVFAPSLQLTDGTNILSVNVVFYRTPKGGGNYYRVYEHSNTGSDWRIDLNYDTVTDTDLISNELLYTTGNILGNIVIPATNIITAKANRAFVVSMDNPTVIYYSKQKVAGLALEFPEEFQTRIDQGGDITGLGMMDDKVIIFKQNHIFYFQGEGPNALGSGQFSPTYPVASDVGCVDRNSIIAFSGGIMFKSEKGIYLLDRNLNVKYIGASVEDYNGFDIIQAVLIDNNNQIRLTLSGGQPTLVFDYLHGIWTTFTNHNAIAACFHDNKYNWVGLDGYVHQEDDSFLDDDFVIPAIIETQWFKTDSLQSYLRVFRTELIGKYRSGHTLKVDVLLNYNNEIVHTFEFDATTNYTSGDPLQFVGHLGRKCESIKFRIYDDDMLEPYESFELTAIGLEVGQKNGLFKQGKSKKI